MSQRLGQVFFRESENKWREVQLVKTPLDDKIIHNGVTRRSMLQLARERLEGDLKAVEMKYAMCEIEDAAREGRLREAFAAGTAVCPPSYTEMRL